jgi:hypothetical protein
MDELIGKEEVLRYQPNFPGILLPLIVSVGGLRLFN